MMSLPNEWKNMEEHGKTWKNIPVPIRQNQGILRLLLYCCESQVPYKLIFIAFHCFQILLHDHLLIPTHTMLTLHYMQDSIVFTAS